MMICPRCGKPMEEGTACPCGYHDGPDRISSDETMTYDGALYHNAGTSGKKNIPVMICGIALILLVAVLVIVLCVSCSG